LLVDERPIESHCCTPAAAHARTPSSKTPFAVTELAPRAYHSEITATHSRFQLCGAYAFARVAAKERPPRRRNRVSGFGKSWGVLCLSSSTTLKAGSVAPQATIRRSAAEEEKCRLTLPATCDTAHPKRQNAAERGRALYRGRTRAERFCNRCGFTKRAPPRATLGGLVGSLRAPRSVAARSLHLLALALSRFPGSSPCDRVASCLFAMATTAAQPCSRCLVQCWSTSTW
jgi:hypothetical protein